MEIRLHANATTTPKQRAYIQRSSRPAAELAVEIGVSETTVRRWRARDTVRDRPHTPHRPVTTLNPLQEFVVVELRKLLLLPLDDLLVVAREFACPALSRSALDGACVATAWPGWRTCCWRRKANPRCPRLSRITNRASRM